MFCWCCNGIWNLWSVLAYNFKQSQWKLMSRKVFSEDFPWFQAEGAENKSEEEADQASEEAQEEVPSLPDATPTPKKSAKKAKKVREKALGRLIWILAKYCIDAETIVDWKILWCDEVFCYRLIMWTMMLPRVLWMRPLHPQRQRNQLRSRER